MIVCPTCHNVLFDDLDRCMHCRAIRPREGWDVEDHEDAVLLGRYAVERRLGAGATGAVWVARDRRSADGVDPRVAVKFLHRRHVADANLLARFRREALAASQVDHPCVARTIAYGEQNGDVYLVMEYVDGRSLERRLRVEGALPLADAVGIAAQIADGLAAAHAFGVVHRDLKPDNVWLVRSPDARSGDARSGDARSGDGTSRRREERAKILDFGYALIRGEEHGAIKVTRTGLLVGSPAYMAPEQTHSKADVDGRTDLYALGVVLYRMIAGRRPLHARSLMEQIRLHRQETPPTLRRSVEERTIPRRLDRVVMKLLEKDPARRFQTAEDAARALRALRLPVERASEAVPVAAGGGPPPLPPNTDPSVAGRAARRAGILGLLRGLG